MKIFKKIIIEKILILRTVLQVIDPKNADFSVIFFRKTPPGGARGQIGSKFTFNGRTSNYYQTEALDMKKPKKLG